MHPEIVSGMEFTITVRTNRKREVIKTGTTFAELADALDELAEESLSPFGCEMDAEDPDWWEVGDEFEETDESGDQPTTGEPV